MSLIHGSTGLIYFVHQFKPQFIEAALLADPAMLEAVTQINRQIHNLAPVLNSPTVPGAVRIETTPAEVPVDCLVKRQDGATYLFAVAMRNAKVAAQFTMTSLPAEARAEVIGESRNIPVVAGRFQDEFEPYAVRLYRITKP